MARGSLKFQQRDVTRAIKAVVAAGCDVARAEIDPSTGKIIVVVGKVQEPAEEGAGSSEWDRI